MSSKPELAGRRPQPCNDCGSPYRADFRRRLLRCSVSPPEVMLCPDCYAKREADCAPAAKPEDIDFSDPGAPLPTGKTMALRDSSHAYHKLGDIGRPRRAGRTEFIFVHADKPCFLVGNFCEGYGFIHVHFPREACRELTAEEEAWLSGRQIVVGPWPLVGKQDIQAASSPPADPPGAERTDDNLRRVFG